MAGVGCKSPELNCYWKSGTCANAIRGSDWGTSHLKEPFRCTADHVVSEPSFDRLTREASARSKATENFLGLRFVSSDDLHRYLPDAGTIQQIEKVSFGRSPAYYEYFCNLSEMFAKTLKMLAGTFKT